MDTVRKSCLVFLFKQISQVKTNILLSFTSNLKKRKKEIEKKKCGEVKKKAKIFSFQNNEFPE